MLSSNCPGSPAVAHNKLPTSVAVTGATGFLGSHLTRTLAERGVKVVALGRNLQKGMALESENVLFRPVALEDRAGLAKVFSSVEMVVHAAALSAPWGKKKDFEEANVDGTRNVVNAAEIAGVSRLVYISSPSVSSAWTHQRGIVETASPPQTFVSEYSRTKLLAEQLLEKTQLETVILRPKAIYGPGDTSILPRILKAARAGRLKQIGDGKTVINMTHVGDVVDGIILAMTAVAAPGKVYTLTGDEDIILWELLADIVDQLSLPPITGKWSVHKARYIALILEQLWRVFRLPGEPPLTRYVVSILGYDNTYDIGAAKRELGYSPHITIAQGLEELVRGEGTMPRIDPVSSPKRIVTGPRAEVNFALLNSGLVTTRSKYFDVDGNMSQIHVPNMFAVLDHPKQGIVLFDTGYTPRFHEATRHPPHCLYAKITPVTISPEQTAVSQLRQRGISADSVKWIILSHFHPDHYGGLKDFPNATVVCRADAWAAAAGKTGLAALRAFILPGHIPEDICARLCLLPHLGQRQTEIMANHFDLFGDGSVRLVDLPGHAPGHVGACIRGAAGRQYLMVADAVWTMASLGHPGRGLHRWISDNIRQRDTTVRELYKFQLQHADVAIIPSHCPVTARSHGLDFDSEVRS